MKWDKSLFINLIIVLFTVCEIRLCYTLKILAVNRKHRRKKRAF